MIDRRHAALGVALAASVATSYGPPPALFYGEESLGADPVQLDEFRPIRTWVITADVVLPAEAAHHHFTSTTTVEARAADQDSGERFENLLVVTLSECGIEGVEDGPTPNGSVEVENSFANCVPRQTCTRTFCVAVANGSEQALEIEWHTWTIIESDATVDYDVDPIPVRIEMTIEEVVP